MSLCKMCDNSEKNDELVCDVCHDSDEKWKDKKWKDKKWKDKNEVLVTHSNSYIDSTSMNDVYFSLHLSLIQTQNNWY